MAPLWTLSCHNCGSFSKCSWGSMEPLSIELWALRVYVCLGVWMCVKGGREGLFIAV